MGVLHPRAEQILFDKALLEAEPAQPADPLPRAGGQADERLTQGRRQADLDGPEAHMKDVGDITERHIVFARLQEQWGELDRAVEELGLLKPVAAEQPCKGEQVREPGRLQRAEKVQVLEPRRQDAGQVRNPETRPVAERSGIFIRRVEVLESRWKPKRPPQAGRPREAELAVDLEWGPKVEEVEKPGRRLEAEQGTQAERRRNAEHVGKPERHREAEAVREAERREEVKPPRKAQLAPKPARPQEGEQPLGVGQVGECERLLKKAKPLPERRRDAPQVHVPDALPEAERVHEAEPRGKAERHPKLELRPEFVRLLEAGPLGKAKHRLQAEQPQNAERRQEAETIPKAKILGEAKPPPEAEKPPEAEQLTEAECERLAKLARKAERRRIAAEQEAARQRQREADEAEARRREEHLLDEARARQEQEAELARRLDELRVREQEVERRMVEAEEKAKQASSLVERASSRSSYEIDGKHLEQGRYLGAGGCATVLEGTYQKHTKVALKMIRGSNLTGDELEKVIADVERERDVGSSFPYHVNVLPLMGWCREPLCLVTLLMAGGTAKRYLSGLKPKAYEPRAVHQLLFQVALGMNHLHSLPTPILHLDLKGENVLVDENGIAKVSDFGLSKIRTTAALQSTAHGGGTPVYMAPERGFAHADGLILDSGKFPPQYLPSGRSQERPRTCTPSG
ncbi:hypothetical protein DFJ74DRAFT_375826 [Hyaloraphidium curvatum]|nr:hypothetical protein DFJ74DRAFT_375826 [Hyaloraphidium curvatum]